MAAVCTSVVVVALLLTVNGFSLAQDGSMFAEMMKHKKKVETGAPVVTVDEHGDEVDEETLKARVRHETAPLRWFVDSCHLLRICRQDHDCTLCYAHPSPRPVARYSGKQR